ncbi:MAG: haloacid dehalogenase-like hydrolase [Atopobiaceae bacterium]|nr:haloacid dehalogenase-like hydrolase [Atopobiaceae bacterium]
MADERAGSQLSSKDILMLVMAFLLGVTLTALALTIKTKQTTQQAGGNNGQTEQSATAKAGASVDIAKTFPSWNSNSASLAELVAYVQDVCDPNSPNYKEPAQRIATFDMDGTIISEKAPMYVDYMLLIHRVLDDPNHKADPDVVELLEKIQWEAMRGNKNSDYSPGKRIAIAHEFAGMTPEEFRAYVNEFLDTVPVEGFEGMTYGQSFYKPMLEVIDYLRANDFDVWMVSACEREVTRGVVERLGIPADHVVATNVAYTTTGQGEELPYKYTMEQDEQVLMGEPLSSEKCEKNGKVLAIAREIGAHPLLAFGNSSGDYAMLNYAEASGGMGLLVVADDLVREYGNEKNSAEQYALVTDESWTAFSMANDWATIYGEGVTKTELPGLVEDGELAEAA